MPAPFVPAVAPMSGGYTQGTSGGTQTVSGTTDTTNALDSYQGETMLVAGGTRLVGGQNDTAALACGADGHGAPWLSTPGAARSGVRALT